MCPAIWQRDPGFHRTRDVIGDDRRREVTRSRSELMPLEASPRQESQFLMPPQSGTHVAIVT